MATRVSAGNALSSDSACKIRSRLLPDNEPRGPKSDLSELSALLGVLSFLPPRRSPGIEPLDILVSLSMPESPCRPRVSIGDNSTAGPGYIRQVVWPSAALPDNVALSYSAQSLWGGPGPDAFPLRLFRPRHRIPCHLILRIIGLPPHRTPSPD